MKNRVWVVEALWEEGGGWHPTVGVKLTKDDAKREKREWKKRNPCDKFRVSKYEFVP